MRVKVFTPLGLAAKKLDERGWLELKEGATLSDALKTLGISRLVARVFMVRLNSEEKPLDTVLKDGDMIGFFSLLSGG